MSKEKVIIPSTKLKCDKCGEYFDDGEGGMCIPFDTDGSEIEECALEEGWIEKDGKHYCPKCKGINHKCVRYEGIIKAIKEKTHKAQGDEHEIYENLAFDSHSSFGYGVRITLYALSQVLGEDKVQKAMQDWLKNQ